MTGRRRTGTSRAGKRAGGGRAARLAAQLGGRLRSTFAVSRHPVLRRFWIAQMVSETGDWIGMLGMAALLYALTDQAVYAAAVVAVLYVPYLLSPWLSGLSAKVPPKPLLVSIDAARALLFLVLLLPLPPWMLLVVLFVASLPAPVAEATSAAVVPEYAPDEETLDDALVLFQSTQQAANMLGFLMAGGAIVLVGPEAAIFVNACTYLVSALLMLGIPARPPLAAESESAQELVTLGVRGLVENLVLRRAIVLAVVSASMVMVAEALVVVYAQAAGLPGLAGPLAATAAAVAAVVGLVLPRHLPSPDLLKITAGLMVLGGAAAIVAFSLPLGAAVGLLGFVALGLASAPGALTYVVAVREMRTEVRAPVFALAQVLLMGSQAGVALMAGVLADRIGVAEAIALLQIPALLIAVVSMLLGGLTARQLLTGRRAGRPTAEAAEPDPSSPSRVAPPLEDRDLLPTLAEAADMVLAAAAEQVGAQAGALLLRGGEVWRVAAARGLRRFEQDLSLTVDDWLIDQVAIAGKGVVVGPDAPRHLLRGVPLAGRRHLLVAPVPDLRGVLLLARNEEAGFADGAISVLAERGREAAPILAAARVAPDAPSPVTQQLSASDR